MKKKNLPNRAFKCPFFLSIAKNNELQELFGRSLKELLKISIRKKDVISAHNNVTEDLFFKKFFTKHERFDKNCVKK